jgi:hypothetical protein
VEHVVEHVVVRGSLRAHRVKNSSAVVRESPDHDKRRSEAIGHEARRAAMLRVVVLAARRCGGQQQSTITDVEQRNELLQAVRG